eukprot:comp15824_c2_seq1/m.13115 comp15824_c2_seq1/g.13115  ORF comp15824_c2_seq1/g.13115 comp15824_c2_seq1/m.13115 type:complete len:203 (-) comp15824_c2_seq1:124-732(-)
MLNFGPQCTAEALYRYVINAVGATATKTHTQANNKTVYRCPYCDHEPQQHSDKIVTHSLKQHFGQYLHTMCAVCAKCVPSNSWEGHQNRCVLRRLKEIRPATSLHPASVAVHTVDDDWVSVCLSVGLDPQVLNLEDGLVDVLGPKDQQLGTNTTQDFLLPALSTVLDPGPTFFQHSSMGVNAESQHTSISVSEWEEAQNLCI